MSLVKAKFYSWNKDGTVDFLAEITRDSDDPTINGLTQNPDGVWVYTPPKKED